MALDRRFLLAGLLALASCGGGEKPVFEPLDYDYLTKIKLDAGELEIDDGWVPRGSARHVEYLAPSRPIKTLRKMADQRLVTGSMTGRAVLTITDASLILNRGRFEGSFAMRLELFSAEGTSRGTADARVQGARAAKDDEDEDAIRIDLDALVRKMMDDLNVEFQFQVQRAFKDALQSTDTAAPAPASVESQDLNPAAATPQQPKLVPPP